MAAHKKWWQSKEPKKSYDVVIVGGGLHGMACAYYLARDHGIRSVAVLERKHLGFGGSGRNTEVIRVNQRAPEVLPLYAQAAELWKGLSAELDVNLMRWQKGGISLGHSNISLDSMRLRHHTFQLMGIPNELLTPEELKKIEPRLDISNRPALPIIGGFFSPPTGTLRHDAAVWAFAKGCERSGIDLCEGVEALGLSVENNRITGVETGKGFISTPVVLNAAGGWSSTVAGMAGLDLPVVTLPMQAIVTEPVAPFIDHVVVSEAYFCFGSQTVKGDFVLGTHMDPWQTYKFENTYHFASDLAYGWTQIFPDLAPVRIMRTWSGLCDMTPDAAPLMGETEIEGFYIDVGWGFFGFKSTPACGKAMAACIAQKRRPELIKSLGLERFYEGRLVPEMVVPRN
jgi:sarcosine oxidase, subunit beta